MCRLSDVGAECDGFVFCIPCVVGESRRRRARQVPDVENEPKLVVDAFTGTLYPDDNLNCVRAVQVEAIWEPDDQEMLAVFIYGLGCEGRSCSDESI